ncbi:hypothetical protein IWX50DRAFT_703752 [Phyllosticta citricarpa]|uniref:Uncharacterized protein n=1 Tax=Phyllosticta citricarpa TaxID=55181 RepID=A0ABR1LM33_9PEZI
MLVSRTSITNQHDRSRTKTSSPTSFANIQSPISLSATNPTTMPAPSSPGLTEEDQRQFENFSGVVRDSPPPSAEEQLQFANFSSIVVSNLERWPAWQRLHRRIALSEVGAMALGLMEALPDLNNEDVVTLVLQAAEGELSEGEEASLLNLVKSVWDDRQSDYAGPDAMATEDEDESLSSLEEEEKKGDGDGDDDDEPQQQQQQQ